MLNINKLLDNSQNCLTMNKYFTVDAFFSYFISDEFVKDVYIECVTKELIKGYFPVESPKILRDTTCI